MPKATQRKQHISPLTLCVWCCAIAGVSPAADECQTRVVSEKLDCLRGARGVVWTSMRLRVFLAAASKPIVNRRSGGAWAKP